jgi:hypothetical protein
MSSPGTTLAIFVVAAGILVGALTLSGRDPTLRLEATAAELSEASSCARQALAERQAGAPTRGDLREAEEACRRSAN